MDKIAVNGSVHTVRFRSAAGLQVMNTKPRWLIENVGKIFKTNVTKQIPKAKLEIQRWEESVRQERVGGTVTEVEKTVRLVGKPFIVIIPEGSKLTIFKDLGGFTIPNVILEGEKVQLSFSSKGIPSIKQYHRVAN